MRSRDGLTSAARYAAIVAPWAVVPIIALVLKGGPHLSRLDLLVSGAISGIIFGVPLTYLAVLLFGYPAYKLLLVSDHLNAWTLLAIGTTIGGLCGLAVVGVDAMLLCGTCGFVVASVAWLMIRREVIDSKSGDSDALPGA